MKILSVEQTSRSKFRTIWISEACTLTRHEPESVVIAVEGKVREPDDDYFKKPLVTTLFSTPSSADDPDRSRCVGVIEATDDEMRTLESAG